MSAVFPMENSYDMIPDFWESFREEYIGLLHMGARPVDEQTEAVKNYKIGRMGITIDDIGGNGKLRYLNSRRVCRRPRVRGYAGGGVSKYGLGEVPLHRPRARGAAAAQYRDIYRLAAQ